MRDGVRLAVEIYLPEKAGTYSALLSLSPYMQDILYSNPLRQTDVQRLPWPVENKVYHDSQHTSYLLLPVTPDAPEIHPVEPPLADIEWPLTPG
jgi:predicted acyl esterase